MKAEDKKLMIRLLFSGGKGRKRIWIIVVWLIALVIFGLISYRMEYKKHTENAKRDLEKRAKNMSMLMPVIVGNDQYVRESIAKTMPARMDALAIGLEKYEEIDDALLFLEGFMHYSGLESLIIYNTEGNVLYGDKALADQMKLDEEVIGKFLSGRMEGFGDNRIGAATVGRKWLLIGVNKESEEQQAMEDFYSWRNTLEIITQNQVTSFTAISLKDGEILLSGDDELTGRNLDEADIRLEDGTSVTDAGELGAMLTEAGQTELISMNGRFYYASLVGNAPEDVLLLVMFPVKAVRGETLLNVGLLALLVMLMTGLCTAYAFFSVSDREEEDAGEKHRCGWNKPLAGKLMLACTLAFIGTIGFSVYVTVLSVYSTAYKSNRDMAVHALRLYNADQDGAGTVRAWSDEEYLTRTWLAEYMIGDREKEELTREFLMRLADTLDVQDILVYDEDGSFQMAAYSFAQPNIDEDSPFYVLLQGRSYLIGSPEEDKIAGVMIRKIGISLLGQEGVPEGCVLVAEDMDEQTVLGGINRYDYLFRQLASPYGSIFAVAGAEGGELLYKGTVGEDGYTDYSAQEDNRTHRTVQDIGLSEEQLQDPFDGCTRIGKDRFVFSVRQCGENWFIMLQQWKWADLTQLLPAICISLMVLLYCLILILQCCLQKKGSQEKQAETKEEGEAPVCFWEDLLGEYENTLYQEKPYFEERWPDDNKKWSSKTPWEKYCNVAETLFLLFIVGLLILSLLEGEDSMLYICLRGAWGSGFNLHSITTIQITICALVAAKIIIHKILYALSWPLGPRGETVCHLIDSYSGYIVVAIGIFVCGGQLGFVTASELSVVGGIIAVILAIGCESIVSDLCAGILMVFDGAINVGDIVFYDGEKKHVISIGVRTTKLKRHGKTMVVRNNDFKNYVTLPAKGYISVSVTFYVDLTESVERIEDILRRELPVIHEKLAQNWEDLDGPHYWGIDELTENWMGFLVYMGCRGVYYSTARAYLRAELKRMCERNHIQLAMPQIVVHEPQDPEKHETV